MNNCKTNRFLIQKNLQLQSNPQCDLHFLRKSYSPSVKHQNAKSEKRGKKFVKNDKTHKESNHPILPLREKVYGDWCFVGLVTMRKVRFLDREF